MTKKKKKDKKRQESLETQITRESQNRMCGDKSKFNTEFQAFNAGKFSFKNKYFRTYLCPVCNHWHLTTKEKR